MEWTSAVIAGPSGGVEAGTLLGIGDAGAAGLAGAGAVALERPGGRVELRAARDGAPALEDGRVVVAGVHCLEGNIDRMLGNRAVRGALRIGGHVSPGGALAATGSIRVAGSIDRSSLRAGAELHIEGRATAAVLAAGSLTALRRRLHAPLRGVAQEIDALVAMAGQMRGGGSRAVDAPPARLIRFLCGERFDALEERLTEAYELLASAGRAWPGLCTELTAEVDAARRAITGPEQLADPLARLGAAAGFLAAAVADRRPAMEAGIRLGMAHSCAIETAGPLRLTGAGATDCEIEVGGDLVALGRGGAIRGGTARVGGRVRVRELSGRGGAGLQDRDHRHPDGR